MTHWLKRGYAVADTQTKWLFIKSSFNCSISMIIGTVSTRAMVFTSLYSQCVIFAYFAFLFGEYFLNYCMRPLLLMLSQFVAWSRLRISGVVPPEAGAIVFIRALFYQRFPRDTSLQNTKTQNRIQSIFYIVIISCYHQLLMVDLQCLDYNCTCV